MNQKSDWELVDDNAQPKQQSGQQEFGRHGFNQKAILFSLLGKYPRLKLAGMATIGVVMMAIVALFSLMLLAGATAAGILVLFAAWFRTKFYGSKKQFAMNSVGK